ncbi:helix-turn-helix domain-containing protein [Altererythrobacter sp. CAU 1778]
MKDELAEGILSELQMLRKLKMIEMLDAGYSQSKLANALGVSQSTISRMMAPTKSKEKAKPD